MSLAVLVAALGYFVDVYDLLLWAVGALTLLIAFVSLAASTRRTGRISTTLSRRRRGPPMGAGGVLCSIVVLLAACGQPPVPPTDPQATIALLSSLADDSLQGRFTGEPGAIKAAEVIAREMQRLGLTPAGDSGYFERVPIVVTIGTFEGRTVGIPMLVASFAERDTFPMERRRPALNVLGLIRGSDEKLRDEYIIVDAHYDHLGVGRPVGGDSIYNGADDDASGVVAVLSIAGAISKGPRPKRSILFAAMTGEEEGLLGTRYFVSNPTVPLDKVVGNLEIEMIGRPDSLAGGVGKAWLTGYERSNAGDALAKAGVPIVPDPRPAESFFERSDNIAFARRGIVAHTLSSFSLHADYHQPSDEVSRVDGIHMARVIDAAVVAVRILADGPKPEWKPGGKP